MAAMLIRRIEADATSLEQLMIEAGAPFDDAHCNRQLGKLVRRVSRLRDDAAEIHADGATLCMAGDPTLELGGPK